jgi:hypothetical protein
MMSARDGGGIPSGGAWFYQEISTIERGEAFPRLRKGFDDCGGRCPATRINPAPA